MGDSDKEIEIDLLKLISELWHRAWIIVLATILMGVAAMGGTKIFITPLYQSTAMMYVNNSSYDLGGTSFSLSDLSAAQGLVGTYIAILQTRGTLEEVAKKAEVSYTYEELSKMITATQVNSTEIFSVSVLSESPEEAKIIVNMIAVVLPQRISEIVDGSSVRIVDYGIVPAEKYSPSLTKNSLIGAMLGFVLSIIAIALHMLTDTLIPGEDYLLQAYPEIPLLASIPDMSVPQKTSSYYRQE